MQFDRKPYFMNDPSWYKEVDMLTNDDPDFDRGYVLTDAAPQEAVESYNAYYTMLEADDAETMFDKELAAKAFG